MKKIFLFVMACICLLSFTVYASENEETENINKQAQIVDSVEPVQEDQTETYENVYVDVKMNGDGYYSFMSDVKLDYVNGEIGSLNLDEPILLSFAISSKYGKEAWLFDKNEGEALLRKLNEINQELKKQGNQSLSSKVEKIISELKNKGPIAGSST